MIIKHITVRNLGAVKLFDAALDEKLNILHTPFSSELSAAIGFLSLSKAASDIYSFQISEDTLISAEVLLKDEVFRLEAKPVKNKSEPLTLMVRDSSLRDKSTFYLSTLSHCKEQDATEAFDGQDSSISHTLFRYLRFDECEAQTDLASRTDYLSDTKTFRSHLLKYIRTFTPEPINCKKNYMVTLSPKGKFEVMLPDYSGDITLSETEEKLFRYVCFLNIARFWERTESIRDMHHEKKPILIRNFLEFLDCSADTSKLMSRTLQSGRQTIILTL